MRLALLIPLLLAVVLLPNSKVDALQGIRNPWALLLMDMPNTTNVTGLGVTVAIVDTGLEQSLFPYVWTNSGEVPANGIDDDSNGYVDDVHGWNFLDDTKDTTDWSVTSHGTNVASVLAEVAPNATILPLKLIGSTGTIPDTSLPLLNDALLYAQAVNVDI